MADHGLQFANSLHQMADELQEMASTIERGRKHWKHTGLSSQQRLQDAETAMGKAKTKYDVLAEQYDRARTGDRQSGRFGLKTKSAAQQEEDLNRKVQAADADYATKVQAAQASRQELITSLRPQAVRAMTELIIECDSGLALQLQKFASVNEKLLLGNGLCVSPLKNQQNGTTSESRSLREVAYNIDNDKDFRDHILSFANQPGTRTSDIKYEKHPALSSLKQAQPPSQQPSQPAQPPPQSYNTPTNAFQNQNQNQGAPGPPIAFERGHRPTQSGQISGVTPYQPLHLNSHPMHIQQNPYAGGPVPPSHQQPPQYLGAQIPQIPPHTPITLSGMNLDQSGESPSGQPPGFVSSERMRSASGSGPGPIMNNSNQYGEQSQLRPPQGPSHNFRSGSGPGPVMNNTSQYREDFRPRPPQGPGQDFRSQPQPPNDNFSSNISQQFMPAANIGQPRRSDGPQTDLPPLHPVFGLTLDEIFRRDGTAVPSIVHQCTAAVELFGLDVEGIYRTSGSTPQTMELKAMFDHGKPFPLL
jgi:Rho GTPase-activating protein RGD1